MIALVAFYCSAVDKTPHCNTNVAIALSDVTIHKCSITSCVVQLGGLLITFHDQPKNEGLMQTVTLKYTSQSE